MKALTVIAALLILAAGASGAIVNPANITATPTEEWWEFGSVNVLYDGTGLTSGNHDSVMTNAWGGGNHPWSTPPNGMNNGNGAMANVQFTFSSSQNLTGVTYWNLGGWMGSDYHLGAKTVLIEYSTAASPSSTSDWTDWYSGDLAEQASSELPYDATGVLDLTDVNALHIALSIITDQGYSGGGVYCGLAEIQFDLVPEPMTLAVLAGGGALTLLRRRRR